MLTVEKGRPADCAGRSAREVSVYDFLDALGVEYERVDHDATASMEECEAIGKALNVTICKNLFLTNRQQTVFYLLMMPGEKPFKTKDLSAQIQSSRLSFASPEKMAELLDVLPGSASVLALKNDTDREVTLLMDSDVLADEYIGCHPCENTSSLKIKTSDLLNVILPAVKHTPTKIKL